MAPIEEAVTGSPGGCGYGRQAAAGRRGNDREPRGHERDNRAAGGRETGFDSSTFQEHNGHY